MKHLYTLLTFSVAFMLAMSSCSSSRNTQNTDDIYYSSGSRKDASNSSASDEDEYYSTAPSDNYIRLKAQDPDRWSYFDDYSDYDSYYSPGSSWGLSGGYDLGYSSYWYGLGLGYGFGFWDPYFSFNSYYMWNSWYNPYFYNSYYGGGVLVGHGVAATGVYSHLRPFNSVAYRNGLTRSSTGSGLSSRTGNRFYRPGMSTTSAYNSAVSGQSTRQVHNNNSFYRPANTNNTYRPTFQNSQPTRSFTPSMSSGGGGGFSRPGRH